MANRYAPYKSRWLAREPKVVVAKFTHSANAEQLPSSFPTNSTYGGPFNKGIYSIKRTAAGIYQLHLGTVTTESTSGNSSKMVDPYQKLAGVQVTLSEVNGLSAYVSNDQSSNATTPFVELTFVTNDGTTNTNISAVTWVILTFSDSKD